MAAPMTANIYMACLVTCICKSTCVCADDDALLHERQTVSQVHLLSS